jgi:hypothetical protein
MLEDSAEVLQVYSVCFVEVEILVAEANKELVLADSFRALCQDGNKCLSLASYNA